MLHVSSSSGRWTPFCEQILAFLHADVVEMVLDGRRVRGFRSPDSPALWIRDHADMLRGGKYMLDDMQSAVTAFAHQQAHNGRLFDYVIPVPEPWANARENWEKWVRVPVEADVEYRFVKAAFLAWQATGDDAWARALLPHLDAALTYTCTHPWRWDADHGLVKRPYTIDTWDFDYTAGRHPWLNFQVTDHTFWGLMHGDSSGLYEAMRLLAHLYTHFDAPADAKRWHSTANALRTRANALLFNGRFYTHFHKLTPVTIPGVDEGEQLSLSNPMAINRGLATHDLAVAILQTYQQRRRTTDAFAEWFSIAPPFPDGCFGDEKLVGGAYVNGGIMPLVGGELARAAFAHGFEAYGVATLEQYRHMIADAGATHLWYFPDGTPASVETSTSPEALPTDGWGSSAMLYGFVEGLCGLEDRGALFRRVRLSPRWVAAGEAEATVEARYAASGASFSYQYRHDAQGRTVALTLEADHAEVDLHLLLPTGMRPVRVDWQGQRCPFGVAIIRESPYVEAQGMVDGRSEVVIAYAEAST